MAHQYSRLGFRESSQYQGLPEIHYQTYGAGHLIGVLMDGESLIDLGTESYSVGVLVDANWEELSLHVRD